MKQSGASVGLGIGSLVLASVLLLGTSAAASQEAAPIEFDGDWREQGFFRLFSNRYVQRGAQLDVLSNGTVSMLWRPVEEVQRQSRRAAWTWRVSEGVRPTDLSVRGEDDRNLAIYFVFVAPDRASRLNPDRPRRILRENSARALVYVWGGDDMRGELVPSPYSDRLMTMVLRDAAPGQYAESVDLLEDYRRAFREEPGVLIGLAITADSDDTNGRIRASIANLRLR